MKKYPFVSIIMANWNGGDVYRKCLKSLSKIMYPNWELVVVDNGSSDGTTSISLEAIYKPKHSKLIKNKVNVGFAPANNQGYKISKGKYILLLNNDTLVDPNFLNVMVEKMEGDDGLGVLQPKIRVMDNPKLLDNAGSFLTRIGFLHHWGFMKKDSKEFDKEREVFTTKGACMLIRRKIIEKLGLFDSDFMSYFEESDFCWRVWLTGSRVIYYPKTHIFHKVGYTIKRLDVGNLNWHYYKNRICSLIKNLGKENLIIVLPAHVIVSFGISLAFLIKGQTKNSLIIWKAFWWNLVNIKKTLRKRRKVQKIRTVSDRFIFDNLSVAINWKAFFADFRRVEQDLKKS
ncbi:glycosyltransferase family 2 protein [Patescibacteria group bacterium]